MKNAVLKDVYRAQDVIITTVRGYGEKVSRELPKLQLRVRFSLPAPITQNAAAELLLYRQSYRRPYGLGQIGSPDLSPARDRRPPRPSRLTCGRRQRTRPAITRPGLWNREIYP